MNQNIFLKFVFAFLFLVGLHDVGFANKTQVEFGSQYVEDSKLLQNAVVKETIGAGAQFINENLLPEAQKGIDFGCGYGHAMKVLKTLLESVEITGTDISSDLIEEANKLYGKLVGFSFAVLDMLKAGEREDYINSFDFAICTFVQHWFSWGNAPEDNVQLNASVASMARCLKSETPIIGLFPLSYSTLSDSRDKILQKQEWVPYGLSSVQRFATTPVPYMNAYASYFDIVGENIDFSSFDPALVHDLGFFDEAKGTQVFKFRHCFTREGFKGFYRSWSDTYRTLSEIKKENPQLPMNPDVYLDQVVDDVLETKGPWIRILSDAETVDGKNIEFMAPYLYLQGIKK